VREVDTAHAAGKEGIAGNHEVEFRAVEAASSRGMTGGIEDSPDRSIQLHRAVRDQVLRVVNVRGQAGAHHGREVLPWIGQRRPFLLGQVDRYRSELGADPVQPRDVIGVGVGAEDRGGLQ